MSETPRLDPIVLDDSTKLTEEQIDELVLTYKAEHPNLFEYWQSIELGPRPAVDDPLRDVSLSVHKFLQRHFAVKTNRAASAVFSRMRRVIGERQHLNKRG